MLRAICIGWCLFTSSLLLPKNSHSAESNGVPNFIFFITDDISPDDLGCYGNQQIRTPNLDAMSKRGLVFDNAYLTISSCSPSRCSIITGRYPHNTGAPILHSQLPSEQSTFIRQLHAAGYYTLISGKNHMAPPQQLGFEVSSNSQPSGSENWIDHLRDRPKDRPFFFWLASHDAHHPLQLNDKAPTYEADDIAVPPMLCDGPLTRQELSSYYHEVSRTDFYAGQLMQELQHQGIVDNTYFIYCSDNGRPFPRCKTYLYDSGIKTPLIVVGPNVSIGRTASIVSSIDFAATFLQLANLPVPSTVQGVSFADVLRDSTVRTRDVAFAERNWHVYQAHERAVRTGDWLYIWNGWPEKHNVSGESSVPLFSAAKEFWEQASQGNLTPAQQLLTQVPQPEEMLFRVKDDPHQLTNLAKLPEHQATLHRMRELLRVWQEETGDSMPSRPTPNRQPLHERVDQTPPFGEFPGESRNATEINQSGPILLDADVSRAEVIPLDNNGPDACTAITVVNTPAHSSPNPYYVSNREPLLPSPFAKLPIGAIRPDGWLRKQLQLQAEGMCRHLPDISGFCRAEENAWLAADGQGHGWWEEVPYWLKGFGDLGYVLGDQSIQTETQAWIDALLASQRADGWFGPPVNRESPRNKSSMEGEQVRGRPDMWPNALMMTVLRSHYEANGDDRVITHLLKYCRWLHDLPEEDYLIHWVAKRRGIEILKNVLWLYNVTGEPWLLDLAHKTHRRSNDWTSGISRYHCVDISECFYEPALYYPLAADRHFLDAAERNHRLVYHEYGQVPGGMFGADEKSRPGYTGPRQATETCGMVEMMHSCQMMFTNVNGDVRWADRCEDVAFNSYPAATTADMKALRYLTAPNQVVSDRLPKNPDIGNGGSMYLMTPHRHRCCQHNHSHGWPYYAEHLWLATPDNGLCAMLYCASAVTAKVADGASVTLTADTRYPFDDEIRIHVATDEPLKFPLYLRIPSWCDSPQVEVCGEATTIPPCAGRFLRIDRVWNDGDRIELCLPMTTRLRTWAKNGGCVSVDRGPLTYSLQIGERYIRYDDPPATNSRLANRSKEHQSKWPAWEIMPTTPWNFGLVLGDDLPENDFEVVNRPWPNDDMPWTHDGSPIQLKGTARRIPNWKLNDNNMIGRMQRSPIRSVEPDEIITLLPMGACRLRLSAFPVIGHGVSARPWATTHPQQRFVLQADGVRMVASHIHATETLKPLIDGVLPESSGDREVPRTTFWPHRGTEETIRFEFTAERMVRGVEVYWFDDTGHGSCRTPASAVMRYFQADQWIPVLPSASVPTQRDTINRLEFDAVKTKAVELRVQLQQTFSAGMLELRVL